MVAWSLAACGLLAGCKESSHGPPSQVVLVSAATSLSGTAGRELPDAIAVRVVDSASRPLPGQLMNFRVTSGGGSVFAGSSITDQNGVSKERWTLGRHTADLQQLEARAVDNASGAAEVFAAITATSFPDAPASLTVSAGDGQVATVGSTLPTPCTATLADQYGNPIPGQAVSWTPAAGSGGVPAPTTTTDVSGQASTPWTLGATAGPQSLQASTPAFAASFHALAQPPRAPFVLIKATGDGETAGPGTAIAVAPAVTVLDRAGHPLAGVTVTFAVTAGGGSTANGSVQTDSAGGASCGTWTLGAKGINGLSATVAGLAPATFTANALDVSRGVAVAIQSPLEGALVGGAVGVTASVTSTYQLASVQVAGGSASAELTFVSATGSFAGTLSLTGQPRGPLALVVRATDVFGHTTEALVAVKLDRPPVIAVSSPLESALARPRVDIAATCTDDDPAGCVSLIVTVDDVKAGRVLASGTSSLATQLDLSAYEGNAITLQFIAVDSSNQMTRVTRGVYVESSTHLALTATRPGPIWDLSGTRILFVDQGVDPPALRISDTAGGTTQTLEANPDLNLSGAGDYGFLTQTGALYAYRRTGTIPCQLYEWRNGSTANLASLIDCSTLVVAGDNAIYNASAPAGGNALVLRDLGAGVSTTVVTGAGNWRNSVASNGDIAYWTVQPDYNIHRVHQGADLQLTNDPVNTLWNTYPVTDGINVVYLKSLPCCAENRRIAMHDGAHETLLTPSTALELAPGSSYAAAGGYVVYASSDISAALQIWRHGPAGEEQLTFFSGSSAIDGLAPDGTALISNGQRRYRASPGMALQEIGSVLGKVRFRDGAFFVLVGPYLFKVGP